MKHLLSFLLLALTAQAYSQTQTTLAVAGEEYTASNCSLNWTIGEVVSNMGQSTDCLLTQGFQQPSVFSVAHPNTITQSTNVIGVYPNPFESYFNLDRDSDQEITIQVINQEGKVLFTRKISGKTNQINLSSLSNGLYFLEVLSIEGCLLKIFKINKSN
jgi:hypothetical protein